jgi:hypothetical protein
MEIIDKLITTWLDKWQVWGNLNSYPNEGSGSEESDVAHRSRVNSGLLGTRAFICI